MQYLFTVAFLLLSLPAFSQVSLIKETQITNEALHFYYPDQKAYIYAATISPRGDCFTVANGYIFYGWYKGGMDKRNLMLSRKKIGAGSWKTIQFSHKNTLIVDPRNKTGPRIFGNTHQTITVAVSDDDGKIHILFDHHNDPLNYIVSKSGVAFGSDTNFKTSNFESKRSYLTDPQRLTITYPEINKNDDGDLVLNYRQGNSHGGSEYMHVYKNGAWSKAKLVIQGFKSPIPARQNNYAYGSPTFGNGRFYYAFSPRWDNNNALNEDVYIADAGKTMTGNWKRVVGNTTQTFGLPIRDYAPFLIDDPATFNNEGSSRSPAFAVNDNGDMQVAYRGRKRDTKYYYTYTKKKGESNFTKHTGTYIDADGYGNKFYSVSVSGSTRNGVSSGKIVISSNEAGSVSLKKELEITAPYHFGEFVKFIHDGKLYIITDVKANSAKHMNRCYEFDLGSADDGGGDGDITKGWYRIKNLETGRYIRSVGGGNIIAASVASGNDKQWRFVKSGNYYNIDSRTTSSGSGILRAVNDYIIGTRRSAPLADRDKVWRINAVSSPAGTFRLELKDTRRYMYNETTDGNKVIKLNTKVGNRSKWMLELVETIKSAPREDQSAVTPRGVRLFPNPTSARFFVQLEGMETAEVSILDLQGRTLLQRKVQGSLELSKSATLPAGIYFVQVVGDQNDVYTHKLVIR